ncbi:MAG: response regulator [Thermoflexales bacterium]
MKSPQATVLVVDDDAFNRKGLHQYLALNDFAVLEAGDCSTAWALFQAQPTDAAIIDLSIPEQAGARARPSEAQGLTLAQQIKQHRPQTAVVIFSAYEDRAAEAMQLMRQGHGGIAYILKGCAPDMLLSALRATLEGRVMVDPEVSQPNRFAQLLLAQMEPDERAAVEAALHLLHKLSPAEWTIAGHIRHGRHHKAIAAALGVSEQTIANRISQIYDKLGFANLPVEFRPAALLVKVLQLNDILKLRP